MNEWKMSSYQGGLSWDLFLLSILVGKCCHWHWLSTSLSPVVQVPESLLLNTPFTTSALTSPIKNFSILFSSISFIDCWGRLSYLSLVSFVTLHSNGYIFPFHLWVFFFFFFLLLFFSKLFVSPPQTAILLFRISFPWGCSWSLFPIQCHEPPSIVHQALCLSDLVP